MEGNPGEGKRYREGKIAMKKRQANEHEQGMLLRELQMTGGGSAAVRAARTSRRRRRFRKRW